MKVNFSRLFSLKDVFFFWTGLLIGTLNPDMFRALHKFELSSDHVYAVTVGASSKQTAASWHLLEPADVISTIALLNSSSCTQDY